MKKFFVILTILIAVTGIARAEQQYQVLEPLPSTQYENCVKESEDNAKCIAASGTSEGFNKYVNSVFNVGIIVAIMLAVIMLVIGGIEYMGSEGPFSKESAKKKFQGAIFGLILALGIYLLLSTINPDLVKLNLKIETGEPAPSIPTAACTIQPLSAITDALAQRMESGGGIVWENTNPRLKCAATRLVALSVGGNITSAYRPESYQSHLFEIRDRWCVQGLRSNTDPSCGSVKSAVSAEVSKHFGSNWDCGSVAQNNSTHNSGIGVDISGANTFFARQACLIWRNYPGDPWHYDLDTSCTTVCNL